MFWWQLFCGIKAIDNGWDAYEKFNPKDYHSCVKSCINLTAMCAYICCILNQESLAKMFKGKPSNY